jgi:hypothetical protein
MIYDGSHNTKMHGCIERSISTFMQVLIYWSVLGRSIDAELLGLQYVMIYNAVHNCIINIFAALD